jgi:hypothetical protein
VTAVVAYGHHHGGGVVGFLAHSVIWHVVGRLVYRLPLSYAAVAGGLAVLVLLVGRRRRRR